MQIDQSILLLKIKKWEIVFTSNNWSLPQLSRTKHPNYMNIYKSLEPNNPQKEETKENRISRDHLMFLSSADPVLSIKMD